MEMIIFGKALSRDGDGGEGDEQGDQQEDRKKKDRVNRPIFAKRIAEHPTQVLGF